MIPFAALCAVLWFAALAAIWITEAHERRAVEVLALLDTEAADYARASARNAELVRRLEALVRSPEADQYRDEACRHAVAQPYAGNRYVRLLDAIREVLG